MKVLVIWPVSGIGGVQRYNALLSKALLELGHDVHLLLPNTISPQDVERYHGVSLKGARAISYGVFRCGGPYCDLANSVHANLIAAKIIDNYDIIFLDAPPYRPTASRLEKEGKYVYYIHGAITTPKPRPFLTLKLNRFILNTLPNMLIDYAFLRHSDRVYANSVFTAILSRQALGFVPRVIYPPVDIDLVVAQSSEKEVAVSMLARFSSAKGFDIALSIFSETVKKCSLVKSRFYIIGAANSMMEYRNIKNLLDIAKTLRIEKQIYIIVNASIIDVYKILNKSMAFMHIRPNEPFGIVVVEAMAAGAVPIVHKSGGPWYDITEMGKYGLGFTNKAEAVEHLCNVLVSDKEFSRASALARERAKRFSYKEFIKNIDKAILNVHYKK